MVRGSRQPRAWPSRRAPQALAALRERGGLGHGDSRPRAGSVGRRVVAVTLGPGVYSVLRSKRASGSPRGTGARGRVADVVPRERHRIAGAVGQGLLGTGGIEAIVEDQAAAEVLARERKGIDRRRRCTHHVQVGQSQACGLPHQLGVRCRGVVVLRVVVGVAGVESQPHPCAADGIGHRSQASRP